MAAYKAANGLSAGELPATRLLGMAGALAQTGVKSGEMAAAAAQTIGYRTAMMAAAMGDPRKLANPEFVRMGAEKVEAAAEAVQEIAEGVVELQHAWMAFWSGQARLAAGFMGGPSPCSAMELFQESMDAGINAGLRFAESAADLAGAGLGPIHRKTRANAKRLARKARF